MYLLIAWGTVLAGEAPKPAAVNGVIDLRYWDFQHQGSIPLSGQWEFFWQMHLPAAGSATDTPDPVIVPVPEAWNRYRINDETLPGQGYATYRLRVLMPVTGQPLGIRLIDESTAIRLYVNGIQVYAAGTAGRNAETTRAAYKPAVVELPPCFPEMEVVAHISNFQHWQGGLWERIALGHAAELRQNRDKRLYLEALMFGSILIMGIYHLFLFGFRPQDKSSLYFGLFCLMMAIRTITHGERFILILMPWLSWEVLVRWICITSHLCIPLFIHFCRSVFPKDIHEPVVHTLTALALICVLVSLFAPPRILMLTIPFIQCVIILALVYGIRVAWQVIRNKRQDAAIFLAGFLIFSVAVVNDVLYTRQIIVTFHMASLGTLLFILCQAVLISRRFSRAFFLVRRQQRTLKKEIEQRKKAEAAVLVAAEQEKYALVGQVAGKIAHDFNNILGAVMGHAELSLLDCNQESIRKSLNVILDQTKQSRILTRNLVAFAKDQEPREARVNINDKIEMAMALLKKDLEQVEVRLDLAPDLPDLLADPGMIEQALVNLLLNAIQAMSLTPLPRLTLASSTGSGRIYLEITDNGCGIPRAHQKDIFTPAFTLKGSQDETGAYKEGIRGTGYGMANVKKCLDKHGAVITFTSEPGKGTSFFLSFPAAVKGKKSVPAAPGHRVKGTNGKRILVVEDEATISFVLKKILTSPPFSNDLVIVRDGESAISMVNERRFDLVSLDYMLPGRLSGMDVYRHLRARDAETPIVFVSGNIHFIESIKGIKKEDPFMDHLVKPFENMEYAAMIAKWLA